MAWRIDLRGDMNADHLHWNPPGLFVMNTNGDWTLTASHVANMQSSPTGPGWSYDWDLQIDWHDWVISTGGQGHPGKLIYTGWYHLVTMSPVEEVFNCTANGHDPEFVRHAASCNCAVYSQHIR